MRPTQTHKPNQPNQPNPNQKKQTAYIHLYGADGARLQLVERITRLERERDALLAQLPPAAQAHVRRRQRAAAVEPGADRWAFPSPIRDERRFRAEVLEAEGGGGGRGGGG
jgi:hypothetical protein